MERRERRGGGADGLSPQQAATQRPERQRAAVIDSRREENSGRREREQGKAESRRGGAS